MESGLKAEFEERNYYMKTQNKYNQAIAILRRLGVSLPNRLNHTVYAVMERKGFTWDAQLKRWV